MSDRPARVGLISDTHKSVAVRQRRADRDVFVVNPGAAGPRRFHLPARVALLIVTDRAVDVRIVEID